MNRLSLIGLACLAVLGATAAEKWTVEDVLFQESVGGLELSRDGKMAVYIKSRMDREKGESVSNLYMKPTAGGDEITLTRGKDNYSSPRFSPSGKRIAFLTSRKAADAPAAGAPGAGPSGMQIWLMDTRGGEAWQATRFERGVRSFGWIDDDTLLIAAPEDPALHDQKVKERKDTSQVIDDEQHASPVRLFKFEIKGSKATRLTTNTDRITSVTVSPDGKYAVTVHNRSLTETYNQKVKPVVMLNDLAGGTAKLLFANEKLYPRNFDWTADSKSFYFAAPYTTHPYLYNASINLLYTYDVASGRHQKIELDWENGLGGYGGGVTPTPDGFLALLANGARNKAARYTKSGAAWTRQWIEGDHATNMMGFTIPDDGSFAIYTHTTASVPAVQMIGKLNGNKVTEAKPFIETNAGWKKKPIAKTELVTWKGALGEQVEGVLYYPHNYQAGKKHPLVVMIHGGPHGADMDAFSERMGYPHQLFAQRGAFILKPNYHGSSNYGLKFGESISRGKYNDLEWIDVETGVDALIAKGLVDPKMLGVMGWSNGSIISIELTTRTTRYKAAGAGAGDVNYTSDWGNASFGDAFNRYYIGTSPLEDPELYQKKSALFRMDKVTTPTIIFFGTEDKNVPTEQGWQHYRALQHYGKAPVKFILFPGEPHGPRKLVHQRRKLEEELAWFDKYLFETAKDEVEALRKESPLAAAALLAKQTEVPETVERGPVQIGRFEVTRAQFKAYDASYAVKPGAENHPASGITFERAKAYCEWLSKKTGQKYRLGTEEELGSLLKASKSENTLDAWAGYAVNADDEKRLASMVDGLGAGALLKPVGSYAGTGEEPLFDLGGNAAEWVTAKDGTGKVLGGSADRPVDPKSTSKARLSYTGFRVVRE